ncbi:hypothetical protein ACFSFZ_05720 [Mixta tenebrionis]|uniref:Uncharacterized protein n=1 Tax=Mixta tenebrionis TaxID=2562439 RepID=A0A506V5J8_9GAMM|nr:MULTISPECIES: hypothetical protein [Mixta]TPW41174.1 hypothetical protein FKM52_15050 [Mixta tenebrionis]
MHKFGAADFAKRKLFCFITLTFRYVKGCSDPFWQRRKGGWHKHYSPDRRSGDQKMKELEHADA